jgi:RNA polymerase sigma-70 factor (ECF subfamily)
MSAPSSQQQITRLLQAWREGDGEALDALIPLVYDELRRLARRYMRGQKPGHTLQTTALVNEAYMRLVGSDQVRWQNRTHFFAVSAQVMRRILVDFARARTNLKRGGGAANRVTFDEAIELVPGRRTDLVALDDALRALADLNARQSQIVELRYFGGLTEEETAEVLGISERTVRREWALARAWLFRELGGQPARSDRS